MISAGSRCIGTSFLGNTCSIPPPSAHYYPSLSPYSHLVSGPLLFTMTMSASLSKIYFSFLASLHLSHPMRLTRCRCFLLCNKLLNMMWPKIRVFDPSLRMHAGRDSEGPPFSDLDLITVSTRVQ